MRLRPLKSFRRPFQWLAAAVHWCATLLLGLLVCFGLSISACAGWFALAGRLRISCQLGRSKTASMLTWSHTRVSEQCAA